MKKILILSALFLVIPALALASSTVALPDFEKEAKVGRVVMCDNGKTKVTDYETQKYFIVVTEMQSGDTLFYMDDGKKESFMMSAKNSKEIIEISGGKYDNIMKEKAPNAFNEMWQKKNDCKK